MDKLKITAESNKPNLDKRKGYKARKTEKR